MASDRAMRSLVWRFAGWYALGLLALLGLRVAVGPTSCIFPAAVFAGLCALVLAARQVGRRLDAHPGSAFCWGASLRIALMSFGVELGLVATGFSAIIMALVLLAPETSAAAGATPSEATPVDDETRGGLAFLVLLFVFLAGCALRTGVNRIVLALVFRPGAA
ncbi:MAG: hypothetical protein ACFBRM_02310 [Pikeienuella sp.]